MITLYLLSFAFSCLYIQNIGKIITVCKKIVKVKGPWLNVPKKLGIRSVNGSIIIYPLILDMGETHIFIMLQLF
jgi:hypothetical protein